MKTVIQDFADMAPVHRGLHIPTVCRRRLISQLTLDINPLTAKLFNLNFHLLEVVSR